MRYTEENTDIRTVPAGELWVGIINAPQPYIAIATRLDDEVIIVSRLSARDALEMAGELVRLSDTLNARNN
ncbi:MAG: hypothetical protein WKF41_04100 [Gaiellaceae bacterium]